MVRFSASLLLTALLAQSVNAFTPLAQQQRYGSRHAVASVVVKSEPSDTSSDPFYDDDVVTVESENYTPTNAEALVTDVLDMIPNSFAGIDDEKRAIINEVLLKLEALNPTKNPCNSPLLNGVWELRYAAGYSAEGALQSPTR